MRRRPVLRYHGGKWKLARWVIQHFPPHRVYVEPYGGAASVLLQKERTYAEIYNDLDEEIVNVFRVMRSPVEAERLAEALWLTPFSRKEYEACYAPAEIDSVERARRTIIKSFMGFGSASIHAAAPRGMRTVQSTWRSTGFRANSNRSGTTPALDWSRYPEHLRHFCERLRGVVIECRPALDIIRTHDVPDALIYVDPPYPVEVRDDARRDYTYEMTTEQHRELAKVLHDVEAAVVVSGYPCELYEDIYPGWKYLTTDALADKAKPRTEGLWFNERAAAGIPRRLL